MSARLLSGRVLRTATVLLCLAVLPPACHPQGETRPSVLLVSVDTLRPDFLSANGYDLPTTPYIDALLRRSFYFEHALSPIARTTPALASLLTGAYPHTTGVRTLFHAVLPGVVSVAEVLRDAGYATFAVVTNQVLSRNRGLGRGFGSYDVAHAVRRARATTDHALRRLDGAEGGRPVFAWVHYVDPHNPYHPDPEIAESFDPGYRGRFRRNFGYQPRPGEPERRYRPFPEDLPKSEAVHRNQLPKEVNAHVRRLYAGDIRDLDPEVERLVEAFKSRLGDRLVIVFTADHGESLGEHDYYFDHGDYVYNAGTRVPLALMLPPSHPLAPPTAAGSQNCRTWVSLVDVVPTLLELIGVEAPPALRSQLEGRSLVPCMRGDDLPPFPVFAESGHSHLPDQVRRRQKNTIPGRLRAVVLGNWKLIFTPFARTEDAWELYDLSRDPDETEDLYRPDHPEVPRLERELRRFLAHSGLRNEEKEPTEQDLEALRELGYVQ